ncbi:MAG: DUF5674 family protein [Geitlerinemataceae cyanobacterium]
MSIHIIRTQASPEQVAEMLTTLRIYIKLAVDIERETLAGGGEMHADCEEALLADGSQQRNIWGADWDPDEQLVRFESLINIRPSQNNRSMEIQDPDLRATVERIVRKRFS